MLRKLEPGIAGVLRGIFSLGYSSALFISEGYFTEQVIPRELGLCRNGQVDFPRIQPRGSQTLYYCGPIGTHKSMTRIILARAEEIVEKHPFPRMPKPHETALFIAGHGTGNNENSKKAIERRSSDRGLRSMRRFIPFSWKKIHASGTVIHGESSEFDCRSIFYRDGLPRLKTSRNAGRDGTCRAGSAKERAVHLAQSTGETWQAGFNNKSIGSEPHMPT
jgi:hypothetical protein